MINNNFQPEKKKILKANENGNTTYQKLMGYYKISAGGHLKRQLIECEKSFASYTSDKGLITKIY
jgi:hypothetical protein